jgi:hypothetical protein
LYEVVFPQADALGILAVFPGLFSGDFAMDRAFAARGIDFLFQCIEPDNQKRRFYV